MLKLGKDSAGDKPIREISGNHRVPQGVEELYLAYLQAKDANPGKLPIVTRRTPGRSSRAPASVRAPTTSLCSTISWAPRGDLVWTPKNGEAPAAAPSPAQAAPSTGSTVVAPPAPKAPEPATGPDRLMGRRKISDRVFP
jgi:hypothetical protein